MNCERCGRKIRGEGWQVSIHTVDWHMLICTKCFRLLEKLLDNKDATVSLPAEAHT